MKRWRKKATIQTHMLLITFLLAFTTLGLMASLFCCDVYQYIHQQTQIHQQTMVLSDTENIEQQLDRVEKTIKAIQNDPQVLLCAENFTRSGNTLYDKYVSMVDLRKILNDRYFFSDGGIERLVIVTSEGSIYVGEPIPYQVTLEYLDGRIVSPTEGGAYRSGLIPMPDAEHAFEDWSQAEYFPCFYAPINLQEPDGPLVILQCSGSLFNLSDKSALLTEDGVFLSGTQYGGVREAGILRANADDDGSYEYGRNILYSKQLSNHLLFVLQTNYDEIIGKMTTIIWFCILSVLVCLFISLGVYWMMMRPIKADFSKLMARIRNLYSSTGDGEETLEIKRKYSIGQRIFGYLQGSVVIALLLFCIVNTVFAYNVIRNEVLTSFENDSRQYSNAIKLYFDRIRYDYMRIANDENVVIAVTDGDLQRLDSEMGTLIGSSFGLANHSGSLLIVDDGAVLYQSNDAFGKLESYVLPANIRGSFIQWEGLQKDSYGKWVYVVCYPIITQNTVDSLYLLHVIDEKELRSLYIRLALRREADIYLCDNAGTVISSISEELIGGRLYADDLQEHKEAVYQYPIPNTPVRLVALYHVQSLYDDLFLLFRSEVILAMALILVIMLVSAFVRRRLIMPLTNMKHLYENVESVSVEDCRKISYPTYELSELNDTFTNMKERIDDLMDSLICARILEAQTETQRQALELQLLQSQANPHFLCNALESIRSLIKVGRNQMAYELLENIGDLFRYGIGRKRLLVSLADELAYTKAYCALLSQRYNRNIRFVFRIDVEDQKCEVLCILFQPLIENAAKHGLARKGGIGTIEIGCRREADTLILTVADDGVGMDMALADKILTQTDSMSACIGLYNIVKRLALHYKGAARIGISLIETGGTLVTLTLPVSGHHMRQDMK